MSAIPQLTAELDIPRQPFDDSDVERFIADFARSEGDSVMWLEDHGIGEHYQKIAVGADVLRMLCRSWLRNQMAVYGVCGVAFWQAMKELAQEAFEAE